MTLDTISYILGWTSVAFYISITVFNSMKFTRYAAFGSAANDIIWAILMGWWPKVILNLGVASLNTYRYAKDFTNVPPTILKALAGAMVCGLSYITYFAVSNFSKAPSLSVGLQFADLGVILLALYMKNLTHYRWLMLLSGFVGMGGYWGNEQMMIIKAMVIGIMSYKLFIEKSEKLQQSKKSKEPKTA